MIEHLRENRVSRTYLGGKNIDRFFGKTECVNSYFPEDWTASAVSAYTGEEGIGVTSDGVKITDRIGEKRPALLVKLLDSAERLVIQAHPTVPFAKEFLNSSFGKTECWYFLDCEEDAAVYIGFKEGITRQAWERAFYENDSAAMLAMLHRIPVKKGDFIFVDGGVPHAIGKGCFMIELQEPSDLMVVNERFTPSGRQIAEERLHMGLGYTGMFDVYDYTPYTLAEFQAKYCPKKKQIAKGLYQILGPDLTDKFSMYLLENGACLTTDALYRVAIVTQGTGILNGMSVKKGDRLFLMEEAAVSATGSENFQVVICE